MQVLYQLFSHLVLGFLVYFHNIYKLELKIFNLGPMGNIFVITKMFTAWLATDEINERRKVLEACETRGLERAEEDASQLDSLATLFDGEDFEEARRRPGADRCLHALGMQ